MPSIIYTHDFEFKFGYAKNYHKMKGEAEFNVDGEASYRLAEPAEGMTVRQNRLVNRLFSTVRLLFQDFKGLDKLEITKKP